MGERGGGDLPDSDSTRPGCGDVWRDEERRLTLVVRLLAVAFLVCIAVSWRLWISERLYPLVPLCGLVPAFFAPLDRAILLLLVGLLAGLAAAPRSSRFAIALVGLVAVLFAQDQSRLWPSFYEFFLLLVIVLSWRPQDAAHESHRLLTAMRFVVAAVYFWSGVQKLTPHFVHEEFAWFIRPLTDRVPFAVPGLPFLAVAAAIGETLLGLGLLSHRFRRFALLEALAMHAIIFFCIGPLRGDWNDAAWLWSLASALLAWLLFHDAPPFSFRTMFAGPWPARVPRALAVALVGAAPLLNNVNRWDSALSFNVYTGNVTAAVVVMPAGLANRLPPEMAAHVGIQGAAAVLDVNAWARAEFNGGAYPEERVFRAVFRTVCGLVQDPDLRLVIVEKATWFSPKTQRIESCGAD